MFANILNNTDSNLMSNFFSTFCQPDLHYTHSLNPNVAILVASACPYGPQSSHVYGASFASQIINNGWLAFPDVTLRLTSSKLLAGRSESLIVSTFVVRMTQIYDTSSWKDVVHVQGENDDYANNVNPGVIGQRLKHRRKETVQDYGGESFLIDSVTFSGKKGTQVCYSPCEHQALLSTSPLLQTPVGIVVEGTITMVLDASKRLTQFDMVSAKVSVV